MYIYIRKLLFGILPDSVCYRPTGAQGARLDLEAESLIAAATDPEELAQMYEPWRFWYEKR